jgi:hypothetical protein
MTAWSLLVLTTGLIGQEADRRVTVLRLGQVS